MPPCMLNCHYRYGTYSCEQALVAGLDLEMPGPTRYRANAVVQAIVSGKLQRHVIDERARKVLEFVNEAARAPANLEETTRDVPEDRLLNRRIATESVVLLKNSRNLLPLKVDECNEIAIIGPNAKLPAACGGGSASLRPYYTSSVFQGLQASLPPHAKIHYEPGVFGHVLLPAFTYENVTNMLGEPGVSIEVFNEPNSDPDRKAIDKQTIPDTTYQLMDYSHPGLKETFYLSMRANFIAEYTGTYEFGLATYGIGELYINDQLIIDNATEQMPGGMFFGKGSSEKKGTYEMAAGQSYHLRVETGSAATSKVKGDSPIPMPGGACRLGGCLKRDPQEGIQMAVELAKRSRHTFVVVGLNVSIIFIELKDLDKVYLVSCGRWQLIYSTGGLGERGQG
jgi:beta-glucosidase